MKPIGGLFFALTLVFSCNSLTAAGEKQVTISLEAGGRNSIVSVQRSQLLVQRRLSDGTMDFPRPYLIKGVTWTPASKAPAEGPNPLDHNSENPTIPDTVPYGFFFDWAGRHPQGHVVLNYWLRNQFFTAYQRDISLMKQMNVNTVRVYTDFGDRREIYNAILEECYRNDIMVIMTVAISKEDLESGQYRQTVQRYKDHPAILMWSLGNEWNLEYNKYFGYATVTEATAATQEAARAIKEIDPQHPVASCLGDRFADTDARNTIRSIVAQCSSVDLWGMNVYRGESFGNLFDQWREVSLGKPFYFSEFGTDSFWATHYNLKNGSQADDCAGSIDQGKQSQTALLLWREIMAHLSITAPQQLCLGGCVHEWNDELWKVGSFHAGLGGLLDYAHDSSYDEYNTEGFFLPGAHPDNVANEEYFGITDADRNPKEIFVSLQRLYAHLPNTPPALVAPQYKTINEGEPVELPLIVTDRDRDNLTLQAYNLDRLQGAILETQPIKTGESESTLEGVLRWTPSFQQSGTYFIQFYATDEWGGRASRLTTLTVKDVNRPPSFQPILDQQIEEGNLLKFTVAVVDPEQRRLSLVASLPRVPTPSGMGGMPRFQIGSSKSGRIEGVLQWRPDFNQAGNYSVTFKASNGVSSDTRTVLIKVLDNQKPVIISFRVFPSPAQEGRFVYFTANGKDVDGKVVKYFWRSDIDGLLSTQASFWTSKLSIGEHAISLQLEDSNGRQSEKVGQKLIVTPRQIPKPPDWWRGLLIFIK